MQNAMVALCRSVNVQKYEVTPAGGGCPSTKSFSSSPNLKRPSSPDIVSGRWARNAPLFMRTPVEEAEFPLFKVCALQARNHKHC